MQWFKPFYESVVLWREPFTPNVALIRSSVSERYGQTEGKPAMRPKGDWDHITGKEPPLPARDAEIKIRSALDERDAIVEWHKKEAARFQAQVDVALADENYRYAELLKPIVSTHEDAVTCISRGDHDRD